ncbi:MAG: phosphoglucosamine mutase [Tissierellia bacterium]|nr:phosphoglucosamine mutase [Tissierellia bacterium]
MKKYFGTDGVRGIANTELTNAFAYQCGRAMARYLEKKDAKIALGMDTRVSSPMLASALQSGLMAEGADVVFLGVVPTPAVAFLTREHSMDMGVMISASHNPFPYNGIKLINGDGFKLSDEEELKIEQIIDTLPTEEVWGKELGTYIDGRELVEDYLGHIKSLIPEGFQGMKVAVDAGDGVMSHIAPRLFKELGAEVHCIYCDGDGSKINNNSGSTCPEKVATLVKETNCDVGIAFDGDADRVIFADENGKVVDGDHVIAYAASAYASAGELEGNGVVTTTMSNQGFEDFLTEKGIHLVRADVGDKYVMEEMIRHGYVLGGEQSGHIIFLHHNTMGDGLQTAVLILRLLKILKEKASRVGSLFKDYPQVLVNAHAESTLKKTYLENPTIAKAIQDLKERHPDFRLLIRPSGTEPCIRVMIEGKEEELINREAEKIKNIIEGEN